MPSGRLVPIKLVAAVCVVACTAGTAFAGAGRPKPSVWKHRTCVYSFHRISELERFADLVGRSVSCALVYNDAAPTWSTWERPWFTQEAEANADWSTWVREGQGLRNLVISQSLIPSGEYGTSDWREAGATGKYDSHFRELARNLIRAGLGRSVIRLGFEANDPSNPWFVGDSKQSRLAWVAYWRRAVEAMRSVTGAHFLFDWCFNAYWSPIPLSEFYPGDSYVDIVGIDAYDRTSADVSVSQRWRLILNQPDGLAEAIAFAQSHRKPLSIPEWGIAPVARDGIGSDPQYVAAMGDLMKDTTVAYQSYWFAREYAETFAHSAASRAAYARHVPLDAQ